TDIPILIQGETGTGKEYLARAVQACRPGAGRFIAVNCAAIPEHLIESELFGYAPGAFTGALARMAGEQVGSYAIGQGTLALSANYLLT
ncbi:sigma 54-interacting transcriptional regulator, partial [Acinetobacter baumannii]|uniref:sigma 54-interacting transcriptional regulator n=1 Tax=Acinetobacter baumannii TaxID=470 RepID=UPI0013D33F69